MTQSDLVRWRKIYSLTQTELGTLLGVTKTCVYRWEAGIRKIPPFLALALRALELEGGDIKTKGKEILKERRKKHGKRYL